MGGDPAQVVPQNPLRCVHLELIEQRSCDPSESAMLRQTREQMRNLISMQF